MRDTLSYPVDTIQMPISFYTEMDSRYFDSLGRELFIDSMYILALNTSVPYICFSDDISGRKMIYDVPDLKEIQPELNGHRRWSKTRGFRKSLPEAVSKQYWTAEQIGISELKNKRMIEGGVVVRELLRKLSICGIVFE